MSDLIPDARQLSKDGDLNTLRQYFNEPSRLAWKEDELRELDELYELAKKIDDDPLGWIQQFDRSHPRKLDIGRPDQRRLGKILWMAKVYIDKKQSREQKAQRKERNF